MTASVPPSLPLDIALQQAVAHHQAGRLQEAEQLYRAILQAQPNQAAANHNLGVLAGQVGQHAAGLPHLKVALEANPSQGQYLLSYAEALLATGQAGEALGILQTAIQRGFNPPEIQKLLRKAEAAALNKTAQKAAPTPAEMSQLVALFNAGRHVELENRARMLVEQYPNSGFVWKMFGASLQVQGKDALPALRKAAELIPEDAYAHNNLGNALQNLGQLTDAVASYRQALQLKPGLAEAHYNLGNVLQNLGQLADAVASYRRALEIKPDFADAYSNLGNALRDLGQFNDALASCHQALEIKPDFAEAHSNLGIVLRELKQLDCAVASYRRALEIKPEYADAHYNLGNALQDMGQFDDAVASYRRALEINPDYADAHENLGSVFYYMGDQAEAILSWKKALSLAPEGMGLNAAVWLTLFYWLEGNYDQFLQMLLVSEPIIATIDDTHKPLRIYREYLGRLQSYRQQSATWEGQQNDIKTLYVIGESHSLSAHGVLVRYRDRKMRCSAQWIMGCKQWHLGNSKANKYKHKFEVIMGALPRQSTILLAIGEIDCRPNEGILAAWKKKPDKSLEDVAYATASGYVSYVKKIASSYGHRLIIGGVPATNAKLNTLEVGMSEQFVELIRVFNVALKTLTLAAEMDFLDVYSLTNRGDGIASKQWHIDEYHLLPIAMTKAFDSYCLQSINRHPDM